MHRLGNVFSQRAAFTALVLGACTAHPVASAPELDKGNGLCVDPFTIEFAGDYLGTTAAHPHGGSELNLLWYPPVAGSWEFTAEPPTGESWPIPGDPEYQFSPEIAVAKPVCDAQGNLGDGAFGEILQDARSPRRSKTYFIDDTDRRHVWIAFAAAEAGPLPVQVSARPVCGPERFSCCEGEAACAADLICVDDRCVPAPPATP